MNPALLIKNKNLFLLISKAKQKNINSIYCYGQKGGVKKYIPPILWMIVIFILSSIPGKQFPEMPFPHFDKLAHIGLYSVLGFLLARAFGRKTIVVILVGVIYGLLDETHQLFVPFREFSLLDLLSDTTGVIAGLICRSLLKRLKSASWKQIVM